MTDHHSKCDVPGCQRPAAGWYNLFGGYQVHCCLMGLKIAAECGVKVHYYRARRSPKRGRRT